MLSGSGFGDFGRRRRPLDSVFLAPVLQDRGNGNDAWIGRVGASFTNLASTTAMRDQSAGLIDRVVGDLRGVLERGRGIAARRVLRQLLMHRDQRVEQRLVAALGAAASLDTLDGGAEHVGQLLQRDRGLARVSIAAFMKPVPQIGPELPPTCLETIIDILRSIAPMSVLGISSHSFSIGRKPVANEVPKSPSPARPSRSAK